MTMKLNIFSSATILFFAAFAGAADRPPKYGPVPPASLFSGGPLYLAVSNKPSLFAPARAVEKTNVISMPLVTPKENKPVAPAVEIAKPTVKPAPQKPSAALVDLTKQTAKLIVNADNGLDGRVVTADAAGRFVILNFPLGQMPALDSVMTVYRHGVKVGQIKITGPQRDDNIAADVISGAAQLDDAAREN